MNTTPSKKISEQHYFDRHCAQREEVIEGMIREGQICLLAGGFGIGKTPLIAQLIMCALNGLPFCGRQVQKRPVICIDSESAAPVFKANLKNIAGRFEVPPPKVPEEFDAYLLNDDAEEPSTTMLLNILAETDLQKRISFLDDLLSTKPNALLILDPIDGLFPLDTKQKVKILTLYHQFRMLLSKFPNAAMVSTFNLRKQDRKGQIPNLLTEPRGWLEEVAGTLDIINRSDVRFGIDTYDEDIRIINGIRRSEEMHPMLITPVGDPVSGYAGFELSPDANLIALTPQQREHWKKLPDQFRFQEAINTGIPRASLYRLIQRARSLGILDEEKGMYRKGKINKNYLHFR